MAIPTKTLNNIRTLSSRTGQRSAPYLDYLQIGCLEMEKARRGEERKSASQRIALIDARIAQIDKTKQALLQVMATSGEGVPAHSSSLPSPPSPDLNPTPRRSAGGFKIRY